MSKRFAILGVALFSALVLMPSSGNAPGPRYKTQTTDYLPPEPKPGYGRAVYTTSAQEVGRRAALATSRGDSDQLAQLRRLGVLSSEARALDKAAGAALRELKEAQIELDRRAAQAVFERQYLQSARRRDVLRLEVRRRIAKDKESRKARQAQIAAHEEAERKAARAQEARKVARAEAARKATKERTLALAAARNAAAFKAQQLAAEKEKRVAAQGARLSAELEARRLGAQLARLRRLQDPQSRDLGARKIQDVQSGAGKSVNTASVGKRVIAAQPVRGPFVRVTLRSSNGKAAGPAPWTKGGLQTAMLLQPRRLSDARLQRGDADAAAGLTGRAPPAHGRTDKWIEDRSADETARGDTPVIWNMSSDDTATLDQDLGGQPPLVFKAVNGQLGLRRSPGELIGKKLVLELQRELRRAGCQPGRVDGRWGRKGQRALDRFMARAKVSLDREGPSLAALEVIQATSPGLCRRCGRDEVLRGGVCLEKRRVRRSANRARGAERNSKAAAALKISAKNAKAKAKAEADAKWVKDIFGGSP